MEYALLAIGVIIIILLIALLIIILRKNQKSLSTDEIAVSVKGEVLPAVRDELERSNSNLRSELNAQTQSSIKNMGDMVSDNQRSFTRSQGERLDKLEDRMNVLSESTERRLESIRRSVIDGLEQNRTTLEAQLNQNRDVTEKQLRQIRDDNNARLEEMRRTVDEKLQKTLEEKMNRSFSLVNERLEQVYKGLGEMQTLAVGVGDLKKVLSNVKTRGILGEIQLGSILREILSPEQYDENIATKKGSKNVVEFAVKLPSKEDDSFIYLPIDSKFPGDTYTALRDAMESGDKANVDAAAKALIATIKSEAKDIRDKYIDPPNTTDFAIMFLPFEGLYSEVVNRGMVEVLQREYKVNIAGPSTMAALLNSLQMGFRTLTVQKRSAEVWDLLSSVKTEFDKFGKVLEATRNRLKQADDELDKLVGARTRQIQRKLRSVQTNADAPALFEDEVDEQ